MSFVARLWVMRPPLHMPSLWREWELALLAQGLLCIQPQLALSFWASASAVLFEVRRSSSGIHCCCATAAQQPEHADCDAHQSPQVELVHGYEPQPQWCDSAPLRLPPWWSVMAKTDSAVAFQSSVSFAVHLAVARSKSLPDSDTNLHGCCCTATCSQKQKIGHPSPSCSIS